MLGKILCARQCVQHDKAGSYHGLGLCTFACLWLEEVLGSYFHDVFSILSTGSSVAHFHCKLCSVCAGLFTLKNMLSRPFPLLEAWLSPRSSKSKTVPTAARTLSDIQPWPELLSEARQLEDNLDDVMHAYNQISLTYTPGLGISSPADECEVRGALVTILHGINNAAQIMGIGAECVGGGSGRSLSFTDLVVRKHGHSSNPKHLSALVLGAGEVKGAWQLDLQRGEKLEDMLRDPKRIDTCVLALQQASHSASGAVVSIDVRHLHCQRFACAQSTSIKQLLVGGSYDKSHMLKWIWSLSA